MADSIDDTYARWVALERDLDEARAKLAILETQYHNDSERWIGERDEARAIARRLAEGARLATRFDGGCDKLDDALAAFDALPWAKEP